MNEIRKKKPINHPKLISYPVTPFTNDGVVNEEAYIELLKHLLKQKSDAICVLGSVAEVAYLSMHEKKRITALSLNELKGHCPVYVGVTANDTKSVIQLAAYAKDCGADGIMLSPHSYFALSESEVYEYYNDVSQAVDIPIIFYNNSASSRNPLSAEFIMEIAQRVEQIKFIKDSSGDISQIRKLLELRGNHQIELFNGSNKIALEALELKIDGWCTVTPCFLDMIPKNLLIDLSSFSQIRKGTEKNHLGELLSFICDQGLVQASKAAMELIGRSAGSPRSPLQPLNKKLIKNLSHLLNQAFNEEIYYSGSI